jgi:hypothetical protein
LNDPTQAILRERLQAHEGDRTPGSDDTAKIAQLSDYRKGLSFSRPGPVATAEKKASAPLTIGGRSRYTIRPGACGAAHLGDKLMRSDPGLIRSKAFAAAIALLSLLPLASCEVPPSGVPTAADIRGVRPSGTVTMTQFFVSGTGVGSGTLAFKGRSYPFTLIGSLNGLGAIATTEASGEVYKLSDVSQFPGAWIQGNGNLAISTLANGELWLQNNHGVVMRLNAQQAGITLTNGRYEIFIHMGQ